jgi:ABC-2 type transport system permease protein
VFCVIGLFLNQYIEFDLTFFQGIIFLVSLILGYLIRYLIFYMVGLTTFWFGFVWGFNFTMNVIIGILDGSEIPVDLLPNFIIQINNWLPFKYIVYVPISIFNGRMIWSWELVVVPLVWIVVLYIATKIIFKKGVKAYEAYGA